MQARDFRLKESLEEAGKERPGSNRPRRCCEGAPWGERAGKESLRGRRMGYPRAQRRWGMEVRRRRQRKEEEEEEEESAKRGRRLKRERERENERRNRRKRREGEESISEPPLLACRGLMNANHDPEAARSTCCFPVQIAYNFYCHGRNSSLMEARLISVLVLCPGRVPCVLLPSPEALAPSSPCLYTLVPSASPSGTSLRAVLLRSPLRLTPREACRSLLFSSFLFIFISTLSLCAIPILHLSLILLDQPPPGVMRVACMENMMAYYVLRIATM